MSYKNISICLSDLNSFNLVHQFPMEGFVSKNSMKSDVSNPPAHQVRVAKSAMIFQSIESTKIKLSHLSPSIQRLQRVRTRDLPRFSSPENVSATQRPSTIPLKHPLLSPLSDFCHRYRNDASTASFFGTGANLPSGSSPTMPSVKSMLASDRVNTEAQEPSHIKTTVSPAKEVWPQVLDLKEVVSRPPEFHLNDMGVQETSERSYPQIWEAISQV